MIPHFFISIHYYAKQILPYPALLSFDITNKSIVLQFNLVLFLLPRLFHRFCLHSLLLLCSGFLFSGGWQLNQNGTYEVRTFINGKEADSCILEY